MKKSIFLTAALLVVFTGQLVAQSKVGGSSLPFLGISVGPSSVGMGSAVVAHRTDATALFWNPGALASKPTNEIMFAKNNWLVGSSYDWVGVTIAVSDQSVVGIQFGMMNYGSEEITTVEEEYGTGERWDASDLYIGVTYSYAMTDNFSFGGTAKYLRSKIWLTEANAFAVDFGLLYRFDWSGLKLGMSIANFGTDIQYQGKGLYKSIDPDQSTIGGNNRISGTYLTDSWPLPIFFRVGISMDVFRTDMYSMVIAADANRPTNNNEFINIGTELGFSDMLFARVGMKNLFIGDSEESLAFGFGIAYPVFGYNLKFDISHSQMETFDGITMFSVGIQF